MIDLIVRSAMIGFFAAVLTAVINYFLKKPVNAQSLIVTFVGTGIGVFIYGLVKTLILHY